MSRDTRQVNSDLLSEMAEDIKSSGGSRQNQFKVVEGPDGHRIRILPGTFGKSKAKWYVPLTQHWGPSANSSFNTSFICPKEHFAKDCPFCDAWAKAKDEIRSLESQIEEQQDKKLRSRLAAKLKIQEKIAKATSFRKTYALNIIDRADRSLQNKVFYAPKTIWDAIIAAFMNNSNDGNIFDEWEGNDCKIVRKTENNRTSYTTTMVMRPSAINEDEAELKRLLHGRIDLEAIVEMPKMPDLEKSLDKVLDSSENEELPKSDNASDFKAPQQEERRSRQAPAEEDEKPRTRRQPAEEDEKPRTRRQEPAEEDEKPRTRRQEPAEEDEKPRTRSKVLDEDEEEITLPTRTRSRTIDLDEDDVKTTTSVASGKRDEVLSKFSNIADEDDDIPY